MSTQAPIQQRANEYYASRFDDEMRTLINAAACNEDISYGQLADLEALDIDPNNGNVEEQAQQRLQEMPLSFEKLMTNHRTEEITWEILLGTGGPADRVLVTTDARGIIDSAVWEFQDWFEPWTAAENQDAALVQRFAEIVGFYEDLGDATA